MNQFLDYGHTEYPSARWLPSRAAKRLIILVLAGALLCWAAWLKTGRAAIIWNGWRLQQMDEAMVAPGGTILWESSGGGTSGHPRIFLKSDRSPLCVRRAPDGTRLLIWITFDNVPAGISLLLEGRTCANLLAETKRMWRRELTMRLEPTDRMVLMAPMGDREQSTLELPYVLNGYPGMIAVDLHEQTSAPFVVSGDAATRPAFGGIQIPPWEIADMIRRRQ